MLQKIRKQMAEQRLKDMQTPSPIVSSKKTPSPKPKQQKQGKTSSPRVIRRRRNVAPKKMTKGAAKKMLKAWMMTSFSPTSDYYGETIGDSDISRDQSINTIPKLRKRLIETISKTPKDYTRELIVQGDDDEAGAAAPTEALQVLSDEELTKIYIAFEKSRISKIGRSDGSEEEDEWTFRLKNFSDEMATFVEQGKRCASGKVFNAITKRCASPPKPKKGRKV